jgi:CheY-like chemotaxis protein
MVPRSLRFLLGTSLVLTFLSNAVAQDAVKGKDAPAIEPAKPDETILPGEEYRQFFKPPKTVPEFWAAIQFEIEVGKYDLAARLLRGLMERKPTEKELVDLEEKVGMAPFLNLRNIPTWVVVPPYDEEFYLKQINVLKKDLDNLDKVIKLREDMEKAGKAHRDADSRNKQAFIDVEDLIKQVEKAVRKHLSDPVRIARYVKNLTASPEEREFALKELYRSGALVVPYLVKELRSAGAEDRLPILYALSRLSRETVPPMLAALDSNDPQLLQDLIDVLLKRKATEAVPYLWYLSASAAQSPEVRRKATNALSQFLGLHPTNLPPAKAALTREAERYYQHQVGFADPRAVPLWRWDGQNVTLTIVPATKAEEYYGLHFAGQALSLDPTYQPAQVVLVSLVLDKTYEDQGLAKPLAQSAPVVHELLATTSPELLNVVLDRALSEKRMPVILGCIRTLGQLADVRANRPNGKGASALVQALNYPDRRVHFAAAEALLNIPGTAFSQQTTRIVEILRRSVAAEPAARGVPRVLVGYFNPDLANRVADAVKLAGYEAVKVNTGRELMRRLNEAADIDVILMDEALPDPGLSSLLAQIMLDRNSGRIPILLTAGRDREDRLKRYVAPYKTVTVIPSGFALDPQDLQVLLGQRTVDPGNPPLTEAEIKEHGEKALRYLARLAKGEPAGFDIRPAADVVAKALHSGRFSPEGQLAGVELLARVPGTKAQAELANVVLDARAPVNVRLTANAELIRHVQQYSPTLGAEVIGQLTALQAQPDTDANLRASLALLLGSLRPDARTAGERLLRFRPPLPPAPPLPPMNPEEKKDEEKK